MKLSLQLHPLSYKIISKQYAHAVLPDGSLQLRGGDMLLHYLYYRNRGDRRKKHNIELTHTITIDVPDYCIPSEQYTYHVMNTIGLHIYKIHMDMMVQYIEAQKMYNNNALLSIRNFMDVYDLDDYDVNRDTLYKNWQRYNKVEKTTKKRLQYECQNKSIGFEEAQNIAGQVVIENYNTFIDSLGRFRISLYQKMIFNLLILQAHWSLKDIKSMYSHKNVSDISRGANYWVKLMRDNELIAKSYQNACIKITAA